MKIAGIIPARYASSRLPAKALADIGGKSMIQRVYEQASQCGELCDLVVATDHEEIYETVNRFGKAVMTSAKHQSGTDRCAEALKHLDQAVDFVINIQGDEPFIQSAQIALLASVLHPDTELATLVKKIDSEEVLFNPNTPKVLLNERSEAIYFSRSTIPYIRGLEQSEWLGSYTFYKHIGIYAYRADILEKITRLPPSRLELAEQLEQLRWIENGYKIKVAITHIESMGVDTPDDLEKARKMI